MGKEQEKKGATKKQLEQRPSETEAETEWNVDLDTEQFYKSILIDAVGLKF